MGWISISKNLEILREEEHGRPVQAGEEGNLLAILQEDFGHKVAVDLINGTIALDYDEWNLDNSILNLVNPKVILVICDDSNIVGDMMHLDQRIEYLRDDRGRKTLTEDGRWAKVRTDYLTPLVWRPIWFSRITNDVPTKIIGAQTTTPKEMGARNVKKMVMLYIDGRVGIY